MLKRLCLMIFIMAVGGLLFLTPARSSPQGDLSRFKDNNCVQCHSRTSSPEGMSNRYADWHLSVHKEKGIGCEKCHGGNPGIRDEKKAHQGVLPSSNTESRIHKQNLPETCGTCHREVVGSFVESTHYQKLKSSGLGPSCTTCHAHMASAVVTYPDEGAAYCAHCHNAVNGIQPQRPDIPVKAKAVIEAIKRANFVVNWTNGLMGEANRRKLDVSEEQEDLKVVEIMLKEVKAGWHAFGLDSVLRKAEATFEEGAKIKDRLRKKLGYS